jgi:hypothetical protein
MGIGYAYAQDNVCLTADALLSARGERSRFLGGSVRGLLARRQLPNEVIDSFVAAHMDDAALERAWNTQASPDARALAAGYVLGWNRWLSQNLQRLPAECSGQPWVRPMSLADFRRLGEVTMAQAGVMALADAVYAAQPPRPAAGAAGARDAQPGRRHGGAARGGPGRQPAGVQCLGLRPPDHRRRARCAVRQPALPLGGPEPLLADASDGAGPAGRHGRLDRPFPGHQRGLQPRRGLVQHRLHRQALHAARADAGARRARPATWSTANPSPCVRGK